MRKKEKLNTVEKKKEIKKLCTWAGQMGLLEKSYRGAVKCGSGVAQVDARAHHQVVQLTQLVLAALMSSYAICIR